MRCARTRCGIGLIEILIAASIMVVLLVVVGAMLNQTMGIWSRRSAQSMSDMEAVHGQSSNGDGAHDKGPSFRWGFRTAAALRLDRVMGRVLLWIGG